MSSLANNPLVRGLIAKAEALDAEEAGSGDAHLAALQLQETEGLSDSDDALVVQSGLNSKTRPSGMRSAA